MTRLYLTRMQNGYLTGWDGRDEEYLRKLEPGECLECDTRKARNPAHHKKFFALLQDAFANQDKYSNLKDLLVELKLKAGWYDEYVSADGRLCYIPKSISWARMDQDTFEQFYGQAVVALAEMFPAPDVLAAADEIIARG